MIEVSIKQEIQNITMVTVFEVYKSSDLTENIIDNLQSICQRLTPKTNKDSDIFETVESIGKSIRAELLNQDSIHRIISIKIRLKNNISIAIQI